MNFPVEIQQEGTIDLEPPEKLVERLATEGKLKLPTEFPADSLVQRFFAGRPPLLLQNLASGKDSEVYVYKDPADEKKNGLLKLYYPRITPELLGKYRAFTELVRKNILDITACLRSTVELNGEQYDVVCDIVPVPAEENNNGVTGTFLPEGEGWIRGDSLSGHSGIELSEQGEKSALVQDITDKTRRSFLVMARLPIRPATELCARITGAVKRILNDDTEWLLSPANVKMQIDHGKKKVHLVITDLADKITNFEPFKL